MEVTFDKFGFKTISVLPEVYMGCDRVECFYKNIVEGIALYFKQAHVAKAVLGLSGGIDSAVVAALAVAALGSDNVSGVLLPSQFSSDHSVDDAVKLAENLGMEYHTVPIKNIFDLTLSELNPLFNGTGFGLAEENMQARIRGLILMSIANKFGYILLNTSNKSEAAVGYGTIYGDMCGGISVMGSIYKTDVYRLANYINRKGEVIPVNSIVKPPSAELRPDQKDSDSLPEYDVLDVILHEYIDNNKAGDDIKAMGFDGAVVDRVLRLVSVNQWKRIQAPPALMV